MPKRCILVVLFLCGCHQGFDRTVLRAQLEGGPFQVTDDEIQKVMALKPQLFFPCNLAVYVQPSDYGWRWSHEDKAVMKQWAQQLKEEGLANAFLISDMFVQPNQQHDLKSLRVVAARHGADALLIVRGAAQTDSYLNPAAVFNLTLVGGYIAPSSHRDTLFMLQGGLIDVANGYIYASLESEGQASIIRPTFIVDENVSIDRAKHEALINFGPELVGRLRNLRQLYSEPYPPQIQAVSNRPDTSEATN